MGCNSSIREITRHESPLFNKKKGRNEWGDNAHLFKAGGFLLPPCPNPQVLGPGFPNIKPSYLCNIILMYIPPLKTQTPKCTQMNSENSTFKLWERWIYCINVTKWSFAPTLDSVSTSQGRYILQFTKKILLYEKEGRFCMSKLSFWEDLHDNFHVFLASCH